MHVGHRVADRYELRREIGRGAMGHVFLAEDLRLRRPVAVKVIAPSQDPAAFQRAFTMFASEARVSATMTHPNIVTVYDFIDDAENPALVMELVEGETLAARLGRGERWSIEGAAQLLAQVCDGLAVAHAAGLVHRDLKPANLMLTLTGGVKILDFGIAHSDGDGADSGVILGTPHYMSPEQVRGAGVDARSDLWAVGAIGFEITTQARPFQGDNATGIIYEVLNSEPYWQRIMPAGTPFEMVLRRALAKDARVRWTSSSELGAALRASVNGSALTGGSPPVTGPQAAPATGGWGTAPAAVANPVFAPATPQKRLLPLIGGLVTAIVALVGVAVFYAGGVDGRSSGGGGGGGGGFPEPPSTSAAAPGTETTVMGLDAAVLDQGEASAAQPRELDGPPSVTADGASQVSVRDERLRSVPSSDAVDGVVSRAVARLLDDGAYEDAWEVLQANATAASPNLLRDLRQRIVRACAADNDDLRGRNQPTIACPRNE